MIRLAFWLIVIAAAVRVITNYLYGLHYEDANADMWAGVYYKGLAVFELLMLIGCSRMVKELMADKYFLSISYFTDLAVFAWIKEYFLNPMQWQVFEEAGFIFSFILLILRLVVSRKRRAVIIKYFKLLIR